jgi:hypothetical protein
MNSLLGSLALIALIDSINPNAIAVQVYLLTRLKQKSKLNKVIIHAG